MTRVRFYPELSQPTWMNFATRYTDARAVPKHGCTQYLFLRGKAIPMDASQRRRVFAGCDN